MATQIRLDKLDGRSRAGTSQARWELEARTKQVCLYALPPWQSRASRNPRGLHLAGCALSTRVSWGSGERQEQSLLRGPQASAVTATGSIRSSSAPSSRGSSGLTGRRRLSQTEGLRLRKSRPGTSAPARLPAAQAQPPLRDSQLAGSARLRTESPPAGKLQR